MDTGAGGSIGLAILSALIAAVAAGVAVWRSYVRRLIRDGTIGERLDDPETQAQLRNYLNQLNFIATLSARRLVADELLKDLFYDPAKACDCQAQPSRGWPRNRPRSSR